MNVCVRDMKVGKKYIVNNIYRTLTSKEETGSGGSGFQEPYYSLIFDNSIKLIKDWDCRFSPDIG